MDRQAYRELANYTLEKRWTAEEIASRQKEIFTTTLELSSALDSANFTQMNVSDLRRMCLMYDDLFFSGRLLKLARYEGIDYGLSSRMTKVAGKTVTTTDPQVRDPNVPGGRKRKFEIQLSTTLLFQTFHDVRRDVIVSGVVCHNRLEAAQRVCEHELIHLLEMLCFNDSSCSKSQFQLITRRFFGHTEHQHQLITQDERAARQFKVAVGSAVRFVHEGKPYEGRVNRITRRATVLVQDDGGQLYDDGLRYSKFYVPLERLTAVQSPSPKRSA